MLLQGLWNTKQLIGIQVLYSTGYYQEYPNATDIVMFVASCAHAHTLWQESVQGSSFG